MRNQVVTVNEKNVNVQEKRIGELENLISDLFPESKGKIANIDLSKMIENADFDLLYDKLPKIFPVLTKEDIKNAYSSELESLIEAFINVNFTGIKRLIKPIMDLIRIGLPQKQ